MEILAVYSLVNELVARIMVFIDRILVFGNGKKEKRIGRARKIKK